MSVLNVWMEVVVAEGDGEVLDVGGFAADFPVGCTPVRHRLAFFEGDDGGAGVLFPGVVLEASFTEEVLVVPSRLGEETDSSYGLRVVGQDCVHAEDRVVDVYEPHLEDLVFGVVNAECLFIQECEAGHAEGGFELFFEFREEGSSFGEGRGERDFFGIHVSILLDFEEVRV